MSARGHARAVASLVAVMAIWGGSIPVSKLGVTEFPPMLLALLRFVVAGLLLWPLWHRRGGASTVRWRDAFVLGLLGVALYYVAFYEGLRLTTASRAAVLQAAVPAATAVLARLIAGERQARAVIAGIVLSSLGVLVVIGSGARADAPKSALLGDLLVLASVVAWSLYTIAAKRHAAVDAIELTTKISVMGALLLAPAAALEWAAGLRATPTPAGWAALAYLGAISSALAYAWYGRALRVLGAAQVANYINLMPVVAVAAAAV
ncbi:MAG TPA: DMT family transporter, partial [Xanthomonadales bacterium]|nr:DMT family transporter [Xanthomonadales bacterium]